MVTAQARLGVQAGHRSADNANLSVAVPDQGGADLEAGVLVVKDDAGVALLGRGAVGVDKGNAACGGR